MMLDKTPLAQGELAEVVRETFRRSGIEEVGDDTPAALFMEVARWDGLLNPVELRGLRMIVRQLTPLTVEGFCDE